LPKLLGNSTLFIGENNIHMQHTRFQDQRARDTLYLAWFG